MVRFSYEIKDELGIHARPAGQLVKLVSGFKSSVRISNGKGEADAKRLLALMKLGVQCGQTAEIIIEGEDEEAAKEKLLEFMQNNL